VEPEIRKQLDRICDEIIGKHNKKLGDGLRNGNEQTPATSDLAVKRLGADVLKNVRQILVGIATGPAVPTSAEADTSVAERRGAA
jgi:hypothetical protein